MATSLMIYSGGYRDSEGLRDSGTWHFKTICMATYLKKEYNQSYTPSHTTPSQPFQLLNLMDESMTLRAPLDAAKALPAAPAPRTCPASGTATENSQVYHIN